MKKYIIYSILVISLLLNIVTVTLIGRVDLNKSISEQKIENDKKCQDYRSQLRNDRLTVYFDNFFNPETQTLEKKISISSEYIENIEYNNKYNTCVYSFISNERRYLQNGTLIDEPNLTSDDGTFYSIGNFSINKPDENKKIVNYMTKNQTEFLTEKNKYFEN